MAEWHYVSQLLTGGFTSFTTYYFYSISRGLRVNLTGDAFGRSRFPFPVPTTTPTFEPQTDVGATTQNAISGVPPDSFVLRTSPGVDDTFDERTT